MKLQTTIPTPHQLKDGRWVGQVMVNGKRLSIYGKTKKEYQQNVIETRKHVEEPKAADEMTLYEAIDTYINDNTNVLSPSSVRGYRISQRNAFPEFINKPIKDINFQLMVNKECSRVKPKTVRNRWDIARQALKYHGISVTVKLPTVPIKLDKAYLDFDQIQTFLTAIKGDKAEAACILALHGLRISEVLGLSPDDLDTDFIHVHSGKVLDEYNTWVIKQTNKNQTSTRNVPVLIPRLIELRKEQGEILPINLSAIAINDAISRICEHNNLPPCTCHSLRRSFASLAYHLGWKEKTTMRVGGWSNPKTVNEIYTFLSDNDYNSDIEKMRNYYKTTTEPEKSP